jgi:hypothetical protein
MPSQRDLDAENERLSQVVHRLTEHAQVIDSSLAEENPSLAWHELARLQAFLNSELPDSV